MKTSTALITGTLLGAVLTGVATWVVMPKLMINTHESRLGFEETVAALQTAATGKKWLVPKIYDMQASLHKEGYTDMGKISILSLCQPEYAYNILKNDSDKFVTAVMPCRMGVYETKEGKIMISGMNMGLMSKMFGGNIATVMGGVADEEAEMLAQVIK
ncbi:DUF302 domain-containing protein [Thiothrix fructosivorans]|jgi:uncharacterized protein (DUF302 family)|uniref:DUF302 domain-containing protein n=1 Tax=Thiothrix fructosivorans TaxID=111770 RepID=A0A8B0SLF9_9GAMM|nr:DUF302 domain-containing protein [Thiothrix fructosivorans]MBO0612618.1 DUF302 domain-containing protein [Thiothrix fructosivorans]QTX11911.1 DUF302 domain-containing protein [Thiothrix fructosivorans]